MKNYKLTTFIKESLLIILIAASSGFIFNMTSDRGISPLYHEVRIFENGQIVSAEQAHILWKNKETTFLDIRTLGEFNEGHIPGAINIPPGAPIEKQMWPVENLDKNTKIVVYCISVRCPFAKKYAVFLKQFGFTKIVLFRGGWHAWQQKGYPVE